MFNEENREKYQQYRYYVISTLKNLKTLDATPVSDLERKHVEKNINSIAPPISEKHVVMSPLTKDKIGFTVTMQGRLMLLDEDVDYVEWDPYHAQVGEGRLLLFKSSRHLKPERVINLVGYSLEAVEDKEILTKVPPEFEIIQLKQNGHKTFLIVIKDKATLDQWMPALVNETQAQHVDLDFDEILRKQEEYKKKTRELQRRTSQVRLKRTLDQSYAIDPKEIELTKVLGHGSFGTVYQATVRKKPVAVKVFHNQNATDEILEDFCNEVEIISKMHHPQIIQFLGASLNPLMIVTELMSGDLEHFLRDRSINLPLLSRLRMARDAALGMTWLHGSNPMIIHRDVKTSNFLIDENLRVVVADFGFADTIKKGSSTWDDSGYKGTIYYTAPELLKNSEFNEKVDVYSFGIVLWEIYTREAPYPEFSSVSSEKLQKHVTDKIAFEGVRPIIPADCIPKLAQLMEDCWGDTKDRIGFDEIVDKLNEIILELSIPDEDGRVMWTKWFPGKEKVSWKQFQEIFTSTVRNIDTTDMDIIKKLLIPMNDAYYAMATGVNYVSCEMFGDFLHNFGPFSSKFNIIEDMKRVVEQPWFFGYMDTTESHARLKGQPQGTYLVRLSQEFSSKFILNYVSSDQIEQVIIRRDIEILDEIVRPVYSLENEATVKSRTLNVLLSKVIEISIPCPGSIFSLYTKKDTTNQRRRNFQKNAQNKHL